MGKRPIRIAIVGVGNCASALIQGIDFYRESSNSEHEALGLMHVDIGGYKPWDIEVAVAFDIDKRKVGRTLKEAVFAKPNCTRVLSPHLNDSSVIVSMGEILDGVAEHMKDFPEERTFVVADEKTCKVEKVLRDSGADVLLNYLPVGSDQATAFYAGACLNTGVSLINCMPSFIVSDHQWARRFEEKGIPVIGDDVKSQMGATIIHRALAKLFEDRGVRLDRTYQINTGGNTDFLNMLNRTRLKNKRISKTEAIQSQLDVPLDPENIHIGPSDYVPWQNDNKVCFLRMEGRGFGEVPLNLELRLSVEDSPNSGGMTIDAIRCCQLARERKIGGPLISISAYTMKHPIVQFPDSQAKSMVEEFIEGKRER
ncbi:MAG: inositol-3-phosphate synthase [Deltaproteobacteria bacterium RBG_13_52_11b]|nr:MAG: inositol-3-phosphate synthase [Deltaproteobacteria bacterium RBG_13_52_11b]